MILIKKCDVKSHFAARRTKLRLQRHAGSMPGATDFSGTKGGRSDGNAAVLIEDAGQQPSSGGHDTTRPSRAT
jgi:hypothetical protein